MFRWLLVYSVGFNILCSFRSYYGGKISFSIFRRLLVALNHFGLFTLIFGMIRWFGVTKASF